MSDHNEHSAETTNLPPDLLSTPDEDLFVVDTGVMDLKEYLMDGDGEVWGTLVAQSVIPQSSNPVGSRSTYGAQSSRQTYEAEMSRPRYESQVGPLDGVPRSSKPRASMPNFGQKRAKVVTLRPSPAPARSPGKEHQKLRKTLLSCIFYLANEFYEVL